MGLEVLNIVLVHKSYLYFGISIGFIVLCSNVLSIVIIVMCIHRHAVLCMLMRVVTYIYVYCDVYFWVYCNVYFGSCCIVEYCVF